MIVITGGAWFIGSAFAKKCNQMGRNDLILVDSIKKSDKWKNLLNISYDEYIDKLEFIDMIIDGSLPPSIDAIVHMGACSATT